MMLSDRQAVLDYLLELRRISPEEIPEITPLQGGVSGLVWKIVSGNKRWVLKQALEKLNVQTEWKSDIERIFHEQRSMERLEPLLPPGSIPKVIFSNSERFLYVMECAPDSSVTWKSLMMEGKFDSAIGERAGRLLKTMHDQSRSLSEEHKNGLRSLKYFEQLRLDPFHRYLQSRYPELKPDIDVLLDELYEGQCMVHGDFSPKNILVTGESQIILLDFEVAHWGNPVFDVAFCLTHLMLKAWAVGPVAQVVPVVESFLSAYGESSPSLAKHTGLLLLARLDGKSPADYVKDSTLRQKIRNIALSWINGSLLEDPLSLLKGEVRGNTG